MDLPVASPVPLATLFMAMNHWSVSMGSITWPVRVQMGTIELVLFGFNQQALGLQIGHHGLAGDEAVQAPVFFWRVVVDGGRQRQHANHRQAVALAHVRSRSGRARA